MLLGLICCWLAFNLLVGVFVVWRHRDKPERAWRGTPRLRRIQTTPGPEIGAERLHTGR